MLNYQVKIGLLPMRRNTTDRPAKTFLTWSSAEERGAKNVRFIEEHFASDHVSFVDTKGLGIKDLIFDDDSAAAAIERFRAEKVDAVLMINANFGNEEACADIAKALGKPFCIWAPLDDEYYDHGTRPTDSQCGLFGVSRQLQRYNVPFSHIACCDVASAEFAEGFDRFVRVSCMVKNFSGMRIGQVGIRPAPFFSVIWNEGELMQKFGVRITPISLAILEDRFKKVKEENPAELAKFRAIFEERYKMDEQSRSHLDDMAILAVTYIRLFAEFKLDVISAECWTATPLLFNGLFPCPVYSVLNDMGYIIGCESDMHCTMTMALLSSAALGEKHPFLGEFTVRHPSNRNAELLWHCGPFPISVKAPDETAQIIAGRQWFRVKDGTFTLARIDQENGNYMMLPGTVKSTAGPETHGNYLWAEFADLQKWEDRLLDGPYIHHFAEIEGDYRAALADFVRYFPNLKIDHAAQ